MLSSIALLLSFACAPTNDEHVDERRGFRIEVPDGWTAEEGPGFEGAFRLSLRPADTPRGIAILVEIAPDESGADARELRARNLEGMRGDERCSELQELERELAGRPAPGLAMDYRAASGTYRVRRFHLSEAGSAWVLHANAPLERFDEFAPTFERALASFAFVDLSREGREARRLADLAGRCGSEIDWAQDWEEAARRSRESGRPVLVVAWLLASFATADDARHGVLMERDVIELVNERFVPLWYVRGMRAPFVESYGVSATAFGKALLAMTADGEVLFQTHELDEASVVHHFLRERLAAHPELAGPPLSDDLTPLERARRHVDRGELPLAEELLREDRSGAAHRLRARIYRLQRLGQQALAALEAARDAGDQPQATLLVEEARVQMRLGRDTHAARALDRVLAEHSRAPEASEALYLRGLLDLRARDGAAAGRRWRTLVEGDPEDRFAWRAAHALRTVDLEYVWAPDLRWPAADALAEVLAPRVLTPLSAQDAPRAVSEAVAWLCSAQRSDGSWVSPTEVLRGEEPNPEPFVDAISALAGRALLRHRETEGAEPAARRALTYVLRAIAAREEAPPLAWVMDYTTWSDACMLAFLAEARLRGLAEADRLASAAASLLADLEHRQQSGGGWCYLVTGPEGSGRPPSHSISFVTAAVVHAQIDAREAGFEVPAALLDPAVDCLERMRNDDGAFEYRLVHDREDAPRDTPLAGAAGRGPLCELALLQAGRGSPERLRRALEVLYEHSALYVAERGKALAHAGPYIIGCHYLLFDLAFAAEAGRSLPPDPEHEFRLRELVLACRLADGSFIDNPVVGRSYATAMALLAL